MEQFGARKEEREIKETIHFLRYQGNSYVRIADTLNSQLIPTKLGRKWDGALVRNVAVKSYLMNI